MSLLDLLQTVGRAKPGTRGIVCEEFEAVDLYAGGTVRLPVGTRFETMTASGGSVSLAVEKDGRLWRVAICTEQFHVVLVNSTGPLMTWVYLYFIAGAVWGFLFDVAEVRLYGDRDLPKWGAWLFVVFFWPVALGVWVYGKAVRW